MLYEGEPQKEEHQMGIQLYICDSRNETKVLVTVEILKNYCQ
jgi:hypothetical protein